MLDFIKNILGGNSNERELARIWPIVEEINEHAEHFHELSDDELRAKTDEFREHICEAVAEIETEKETVSARLRAVGGEEENVSGNGAAVEPLTVRERQDLYARLDDLENDWLDAIEDVLDELLPEAFAVIKETCRRLLGQTWEAGGAEITWNMVPYDVQLLGGVVLHQGAAAEMRTGEGKTLTAVAPMYLNGLVGRGVHLVTVNPYLAQRDAEWMGPVFAFHGLTVDCIDKYKAHSPERRAAYRADVTYGTNNEFGFDYLRDNSFVVDAEQLVQRGHHFAIVDEVDSVLIDEARTPLIISGPVPEGESDQYQELQPPVERMVRDQQRIVARFVSEGEKLLKEAEEAEAADDKKRVKGLRDEAGLALLRAQRGFPRNKKLVKLKGEPGVDQLIRQTEFFYLQDNAKRMPEVDAPLHFALEEKLHQIEMTDQGRELIGKAAGTDANFFVIPDLGERRAEIEEWVQEEKEEALEEINAKTSMPEELREKKYQQAVSRIREKAEEERRQLEADYAVKSERIHAVNQLLRGYTLYEKDVEYIVQDGRVMIVDEHTGRVLGGRRYSDGLHQAIEAKEKVQVQAATQTYATITIQNYFRMYAKLSGMTGTAETEAEEFGKIYDLPVIVVPTNEPVIREDLEDLVYKTRRAKYKAVIEAIEEHHEAGRPVLVGTTSVEVSEQLSRMLKRGGISHNVLNAKASRAQQEAQIVADAGKSGAVTIATNMAGRGTDIKLGSGVKEAGGLAIVGTERHESRRIDNQLRGRSGRQGDPGVSQFYVSLEDDLMRLFGHERTSKVMDRLGMEEEEVITHKWITKGIERSQQKVETNNFSIRKRQLEYDDVLNAQREVIYDRRMHALYGERTRGDILDMLSDFVERIVREHFGNGELEEIHEALLRQLAFDMEVDKEKAFGLGEEGYIDHVLDAATAHYQRKRAALATPFFESTQKLVKQTSEGERPKRLSVDFTDGVKVLRTLVMPEKMMETEGQEVNDALERTAVLSTIDQKWTEHLRNLDEVKEGVGLRAYGQKDPLIEYKMEAFRLFKELIQEIDEEVVGLVFKAGPVVQQARKADGKAPKSRLDRKRATTQHQAREGFGVQAGGDGAAERDPSVDKREPVVVGETAGRNDPCPCGSGKKYKHCHGRA